MKKLDIYYFSGTHWDREWYQDFQTYRYRLVKMVNNLMKLIDSDSEYKTFHFDGQTVVLEDYSEICPENKEWLKKLIEDRKILVGPWYVMPDEFLVSGESLIRNLMKGHEIAKAWGTEAWKYGYVCDVFGHIAQMPQIFNGFGIKYSALARGTDESFRSFFRWRAPDGSECINFTLEPEHGYGSFKYVYKNESDKSVINPTIVNNIKKYIENELKRSDVPVIVIMDGLDHAEAAINTTDYIKKIAELYPEAEVHHIDLTEQGKTVEKYRNQLPVVAGELNRTSKYGHSYLTLITNTLSSHYPLKQQNDRCQNLLEKVIEPTCVLALFDGIDLNRNFVKTAYRNLLQNHPHDSICGCSIDQVHKDMLYRFDQVKEIADVFVGDYLNQTFLKDIPTDDKAYNCMLTLQNFLPYDIDRTVTVDIHFRPDYFTRWSEPFGFEDINSFKLVDYKGNEIPYQTVYVKRDLRKHPYNEAADIRYDLHTVTFRAKIPALAKAEYKVVPNYNSSRYLKVLSSGIDYMENDYIRVDIQNNGSLKLTDKKTGKIYANLCNLVDDCEIGDGWFHANPVDNIEVSTAGGCCTISKIESGPERCVFKVCRELTIPAELTETPHNKTRSKNTVSLRIESLIGLSSENRYADIKMSFENIAKDHRLRMLIPTGITENKFFAGQAFYCCERQVGIDLTKQQWREIPYEKSTNGIVGKRDKNGDGIALISAEGIHECSATADSEGTLTATLLRSFHTTYLTNGETFCQHNHNITYSFALATIDSSVSYKDLLEIQDAFSVKIFSNLSVTSSENEPKLYKSPVKVNGKNIVTSIVKCAEDGSKNKIAVRVFNASNTKSKGSITLLKDIKKAELVNLNEEYIMDLPTDGNKLNFELEPWKIATFMLRLS